MSENKCCGNCKHGWTEITPDNVEEIKSIERNRVIICASNSIGYMYPSTLLSLACSLESIADYGGYYYVLPELKINNEQAGTNQII